MADGVSLSENAWTRLLWDISFSLFSPLTPNEQTTLQFIPLTKLQGGLQVYNARIAAKQQSKLRWCKPVAVLSLSRLLSFWSLKRHTQRIPYSRGQAFIIPSPKTAWRWLSASGSNMIKCDAKREKVFLDPIIHMATRTSVGVNRITGLTTILCHKSTTGVIFGAGSYKCNLCSLSRVSHDYYTAVKVWIEAGFGYASSYKVRQHKWWTLGIRVG